MQANTIMARQGSARQRVARLDKARAARLRILTSPLPGAFASTRRGRNRHGITRHGNARRGVALQREAREFAVGSDLWALPGGNTNTARQGLASRGVARRGAAKRGQGEAARFPGAFASTRPSKALHDMFWRCEARQGEGLPGRRLATVAIPVSPNRRGSGRNG